MHRREFIRFLSSTGLLGVSGLSTFSVLAEEKPKSLSNTWRTYELQTRVQLPAHNSPIQLWVPLASAAATNSQQLLDTSWTLSDGAQATVVTLPEYGVQMLHAVWPQASVSPTALVSNRVKVRDRRVSLTQPAQVRRSEGAEFLRRYLAPTRLLPIDGRVRDVALRITQGHEAPLDKARAIYQWVVAHTCRQASVPGCGVGDVAYMLTSGNLNGKCADINALFVALARAAGIPARDAYGIRLAPSKMGFTSLGANSQQLSRAQHCRAEFYAPGYGWVPVDPADVRKVMLEEAEGNLPLNDARVQAAQTFLFGATEGNWLAYNHGHDIQLPGSTEPRLAFLMYPQAEINGQLINSLEPDQFRYSIQARLLST